MNSDCKKECDDPIVGRSSSIQRLYQEYVLRASRLRAYASSCIKMIFATYILMLLGSIYVIIGHDDISKNKVYDSLENIKQFWVETTSLPDFNDVANSVHNNEIFVAVGSGGMIYVSDNSGKEWSKAESGTRNDLYSVSFSFNGKTAIASGDSGTILVSTDFGRTWDEKTSGTRKHLKNVVLDKDAVTSIAAGDDGRILVSSDNGKNWTELNDVTPEAKDLNGLALSRDGKIAVAVGDDRTIIFSHGDDGSIHRNRDEWSSIEVRDGNPKDDFNAVAFGNDDKGILVGDYETAIEFSLNKNKDSIDYIKSKLATKNTDDRRKKMHFHAVAFSGNGKTAIAVGGRRGRALIWAYRNERWRNVVTNIGDPLKAVALNDSGERAVAVGHDGALLVSNNFGTDWHSRDVGTANELHAVTLDERGMFAIVVGENGTILRSESSGNDVFLEFKSVAPFRYTTSPESAVPSESITADSLNSEPVSQIIVFFTEMIYKNLLIIGPMIVMIFVIRYLGVLSRYALRLSAFYDARGDAILFALPSGKDADPPPADGGDGSSSPNGGSGPSQPQSSGEGTDLPPTDGKAGSSSPNGGSGSSQPQSAGEDAGLPRPKDIGELERLMRAVSPDDLDIGRTPKAPIEQLVRLAKVIVDRGKEG